MKELNAGRILFTASIAGEMVAPREAVYAATKAFVLSFAHSLRYELKETGVTVTALQPGPTDTDFFHRAGMHDTEVGQKGKSESQRDDVARQGIEVLLVGKDHVYAASFKTKWEGALANVAPGNVKAERTRWNTSNEGSFQTSFRACLKAQTTRVKLYASISLCP